MEIKIRKATEKDVPQLVKLSIQFAKGEAEPLPYKMTLNTEEHEKSIRKFINKNKQVIFVAEVDGKLVGEITASVWKAPSLNIVREIVSIHEILVVRKYRGRGISTQLKNAFFKWIKGKKIKYVSLYVRTDKKKEESIYRKWGFKPRYVNMVKKL